MNQQSLNQMGNYLYNDSNVLDQNKVNLVQQNDVKFSALGEQTVEDIPRILERVDDLKKFPEENKLVKSVEKAKTGELRNLKLKRLNNFT